MSDTPDRPVSFAARAVPEGRLGRDTAPLTPSFAAAGENRVQTDATNSGGTRTESVSDGRKRFEAIKTQCRYCGRSLDPELSL